MERAVPRQHQLLVLAGLLASCAPLEGASVAEVEDRCGSCHVEQAEAHASSKHARADRSETFTALRERADTPFCDACHKPIGCIDCHAAVGNESVKNGLMIVDRDGPVRGPEGVPAPHATERSEYLLSADLCGTCHEVAGPAGFSESPYTHWRASPAAERNRTCRDCHATHRREARLGEAIALRIAGDRVVLDHSQGGHHFPDGASFLSDVAVVARDADGVETARVELGAELFSNGGPVVLPTDADEVVLRAIPAGEAWAVLPAQSGASFCIEVRARAEVRTALGLQPDLEVRSAACVAP
jgi:hypothetical protein